MVAGKYQDRKVLHAAQLLEGVTSAGAHTLSIIDDETLIGILKNMVRSPLRYHVRKGSSMAFFK